MFRHSAQRLRRKQLIEQFHIARGGCHRRRNHSRDVFNSRDACDDRNTDRHDASNYCNACKTCDHRDDYHCHDACKTCDDPDDYHHRDACKTCDHHNTDRHDTGADQGGYCASGHEHTGRPGLRHQ
jgi:hypothetical protein